MQITCMGEGPVVNLSPLEMEWGQVPVLVDVPQKLVLANESLIPARFHAKMTRSQSAWRIEPESGEIPPESQISLDVIACLNDCVA